MEIQLKKILICVFTFVGFTFFSAQKIDAQSKSILEAVEKNYKSQKNSYFKFVYGTGSGKVTKTDPGIYYSEGNKFRLKIMDVEQIYDGNKIYNIDAKAKEVTIAKPSGNDALFSPLNYLDLYKKEYNVSFVKNTDFNGVKTQLLKLTPTKNNGLKYVFLMVNPTNKQIVKIEQYLSNGDVSVIAVQNFKANQTLSSDMFVFDKSKFKNFIITEL